MTEPPIRSILFASANLGALLRKMPRANADVCIACLEDGTPPAEKEVGRTVAVDALRDLRRDGWNGRMFLRINHPVTEWFAGDVECAASGGFDGVVLPKMNSASDIEACRSALAAAGGDRLPLILGIETGAGVIAIEAALDAAHPRAIGAYFGGEDYATSIGAVRSESNVEVAYPRARVALHLKVRGLDVFDHGTVRYDDDERFRRECVEARGYGYTGKICFHPRQVALANEMFMPTAAEVEWARRVLSEYAAAEAAGRGAPAIDGLMIDGPLVRRAEATVALAELSA